MKEPHGLLHVDGKYPGRLKLIPWRQGRCVAWDATVCDTVADSYLADSSCTAGGGGSLVKTAKYVEIC